VPNTVEKFTWTFTDDNGVVEGSGYMNVNTKTGVVVGMTGTYEGEAIHFSPITDHAPGYNPNAPSPGYNTLHGVPNTGGADYIYDDVYNPTANPGTGVDVYGILVNTGSGANKTFYDISLDYPGASQVDFFSIAKDGSYVKNEGTLTTTPLGGPGNDTLTASDTGSLLEGGRGDDSLVGGSGVDTVAYAHAKGPVTVSLSSGQSSGADGHDTITGVENVVGSSFADSLTGDADNNSISGGGGADTLVGGGGSDTLVGGAGRDLFVFDSSGQPGDRDVITGLQAGDHIQLLDGVTVTGATSVNLVGTSAADTLLTLSNGSSVVLQDFALSKWHGGSGWLVA
jgi:Ca2+-binding RTX toxin-like protein